jgi:hypothetical protein
MLGRGRLTRRCRCQSRCSAGSHRHALHVVGEHARPDPGASTGQPTKPRATQPEATLEMADPRLDPDPPVAQPAEGAGSLQRTPGLAWGAVALQPDPRHAQLRQGRVVGGATESAVADHGTRHPAGELNDPWTAGTSWAASGGLPCCSWWSAMNPRSSSASGSIRLPLHDRESLDSMLHRTYCIWYIETAVGDGGGRLAVASGRARKGVIPRDHQQAMPLASLSARRPRGPAAHCQLVPRIGRTCHRRSREGCQHVGAAMGSVPGPAVAAG